MTVINEEPTTKIIRKGQHVRLIGPKKAALQILCFHGGGGVGGTPAMMDDFAAAMTQDGDVRMAIPEYRTLASTPDATLDDMLGDASAALEWAKSTSKASGIWVLGASFGAVLALNAVLDNPDGVAGVILLNPVTNTGQGGLSNRVVNPAVHGDMSPLKRLKGHAVLSQLDCLIVHGTADVVVPLQASRDFATLWPKGRCKMVEIPNASHGFFNRSPRDEETADHVRGFIKKALGRARRPAKLPDDLRLLCCIGGQKAGTSWLYDQFAKSAQVHAGSIKERHYFDVLWLNQGSTFRDPKRQRLKALTKKLTHHGRQNPYLSGTIDRLKDHLAPYDGRKSDHSAYIGALLKGHRDETVVCDFTPSYCGLSAKHLRKINALGDVKFIYVLRDPVARMWSQIRMKFNTLEGDARVTACVEHGHQMCDNKEMSHIFRANYARTLNAIEKGADDAAIVFYERLFEQATFDELADFAGIAPVQIDTDHKINEGQAVALPPDLEQKMLGALAPQYETVMNRFKDDVPAQWHDRYSRYRRRVA